MSELLTMAEIEATYNEQWVLLADPKLNDRNEIVSGRVLYHSSDRDEFDRRSLDFRVSHAAVVYTGEMPEDMAVVL